MTDQPSPPRHDCREYWEQRWQTGRTGWDRGGVSPALERWLAAKRVRGPRVVVPGAGRGHEVIALARNGFEVTAIDFAPTAVRQLRQQLAAAQVEAEVVEEDFFAWRPCQPFDTVYEQTCLCALPPAQWPQYEACLARWLRPGGILLALLMQRGSPGGPPYHCAIDEMQRLFAPPHWQWLEVESTELHHPNGGVHELPACIERSTTEG